MMIYQPEIKIFINPTTMNKQTWLKCQTRHLNFEIIIIDNCLVELNGK
jgi:hypothetical protein